MKKTYRTIEKIMSTAWGKIIAVVAVITTIIGWTVDVGNWWDMDTNYFIENSKIEKVVVSDCKLVVTYYTAPLPNIDYTTEYWLVPIHNAKASYVLDYHDIVKEDQFPGVIYDTYTRWTGEGIDIPCDLPAGEYEIHVKYLWKGIHPAQLMKPIKFNIK